MGSTKSGWSALATIDELQQWGDDHAPRANGPSMLRRHRSTGEDLHVAYVIDAGMAVPMSEVTMTLATGTV